MRLGVWGLGVEGLGFRVVLCKACILLDGIGSNGDGALLRGPGSSAAGGGTGFEASSWSFSHLRGNRNARFPSRSCAKLPAIHLRLR